MKSIIPTKETDFQFFGITKKEEFTVADEEKWKIVLRELLDPRRLSSDDHMLCWGRFQKEFFDSFQTDTPSTVVGGYRFDLRQESTLRRLLNKTSRVKQKDYILVNTAFSNGNHHIPRTSFI